jgi:hypothetical protein
MIVWTQEHDKPVAQRVDAMVSLGEISRDEPLHSHLPCLIPTRPASGALAALLVPAEAGVVRNGVPLPPGAHALFHGDALIVRQRRYWVAAAIEVAVAQYDPAAHGDNVFCFFTKGRLKAGEAIVVCPGRPGTECSVIYKQAAWELAIKANVKFQCPRCGFDPAAGDWQPTLPRPTQLPQLFDLAALHRTGGPA